MYLRHFFASEQGELYPIGARKTSDLIVHSSTKHLLQRFARYCYHDGSAARAIAKLA